MNTYGYVRVSTVEQNIDRQIIEMHRFGIADKYIFIDKISGKDFNRPRYKSLRRTELYPYKQKGCRYAAA